MDEKEAVGLIIENNKGEILVLHRKEFVPEGGSWGLVGGGVEDNNDALRNLIQKVKQEIGLELNKARLKEVEVFDWKELNIRFHLYKTDVVIIPTIKLNTEGHSEYKWANPKDLYKNDILMKGLYKIIEKYYL